tara:strand:- start:320 stop:496 length:177 start_codon:yes stop_codon:yes gene_type:complete
MVEGFSQHAIAKSVVEMSVSLLHHVGVERREVRWITDNECNFVSVLKMSIDIPHGLKM